MGDEHAVECVDVVAPERAFALIGLYRKERHANNLDRDQARIGPKVTLKFTGTSSIFYSTA